MPRGKPIEAQQLDDVVRAAARVFARLGYRRARMTDVAAEAGLSPGALYTYVEGKDALFHLVVVGSDPSPSLPVPNPPTEETIAAIDRRLRARVPVGAMRHAAEESTAVEPGGRAAGAPRRPLRRDRGRSPVPQRDRALGVGRPRTRRAVLPARVAEATCTTSPRTCGGGPTRDACARFPTPR